jgi:hypothetical protein
MKKVIMILAATVILFGVGSTVEKTEDSARIPVGGGHAHKVVAYIPVGGTSADIGSYAIDSNSTDTGVMVPPSIPVGGT